MGTVVPQLKFMDWKEDKRAVAVLCAANIISGEMTRGGRRGSTEARQKGSNDGGGGSRNGWHGSSSDRVDRKFPHKIM